MNAHIEFKIPRFGVTKLANSSLLPAFRALKREILNLNLSHSELKEMPI